MTDIKQMAALAALNEMMAKGWVDICKVETIGDLLGLNVKTCEHYTTLRTVHCLNFDKMPVELRDAIPGMLQACLSVTPTFQFAAPPPPLPPAKGATIVVEMQRRPMLGFLGKNKP